MSEEDVELVRQNFDAWNRGEDELKAYVRQHCSPDVTLQPFADFADSQVRHGRDEVFRLWMELRAPWERLEIARMDLVETGNCVVAGMLAQGVMKGTEDMVDMRLASTNVVRDGKLAEIRYFRGFTEALEAAGLRE